MTSTGMRRLGGSVALVLGAALSIAGWAGVGAAAAAPTGCTVIDPAGLQALLGAPFKAGTSPGPAYSAGDCLFVTNGTQNPTGPHTPSGQVIVHVENGAKAGKKLYAKAVKLDLPNAQPVKGVGTAALLSGPYTIGGCTDEGDYRIDAKSKQGGVTILAELTGPNNAGTCPPELSPDQMSALATQILAAL